jgi:hypothetical protein
MINQYELEQAGVSVDGVALRLKDEHERDLLADYRRRRHLSDDDASEYAAGVEIGAAWVREEASAAALSAAHRLAEHGGPWTALPALATSLRTFLDREAGESASGKPLRALQPRDAQLGRQVGQASSGRIAAPA